MSVSAIDFVRPGNAVKSRPEPRKFRPDIQGLRAIAAGLVVFYHAGVPVIRGGFVGVDVFFVISGFLITRQLFDEAARNGRISFVGFYSRRARRLLPPVALVVVCSLALARFVLPYDQLKSFIKDVFYASFYGINYHFAAEGVQYQNASVPPSPLQHFWSLAVEEQFYVVWPILIAACALIGRRRFRRPLMVVAIGALSAYTLILSVTTTATNTSMAYFSLQTRAWELGTGALVALTLQQWARVPAGVARVIGWAGLAAILVSAVVYDDTTPYPGIAAVLPVAGAGALIASGALRNDRTPETAWLQHATMQYVGKVSYAWYLWHWPMLILLTAWVGHALNTWENVEIVLLAFWFAVLTYFLENAAHRSHWNAKRWAGVGVLISAMVAVSSLIANQLLPNLETTGKARQMLVLRSANASVVQAAIDRSLSITALPSNLTPTLARAYTDEPYDAPGCFASLEATTSKLCVSGDPTGSQTAVLLGDSHSHQWLNPLRIDAKAAHWRLIEITKAACPVAYVPNLYEVDLKRNYTECNTFRDWMERQVAKIKPDLIIASQSDQVVWKSMSDDTWASKTIQALLTLAGNRSRVAYIGDSPTTSQNMVECLQAHIGNAEKCIYTRKEAFGVLADRYATMQKSLSAAGIAFVNSLDFFCNKYVCPSVVDNMQVHRDNGHITNAYATWLAPMLKPIFQGASK